MLYPALDLLHLCYNDERLPRLRLTSLFKLVQILVWVWTLESSDHRACTNSRQARILRSFAFILRVRTQALIIASCMHVVWRREKLSALTQKGFLEHSRLDSTFALGTPRRFIMAPSHPHQYVSPSPVGPLPLALHGVGARSPLFALASRLREDAALIELWNLLDLHISDSIIEAGVFIYIGNYSTVDPPKPWFSILRLLDINLQGANAMRTLGINH